MTKSSAAPVSDVLTPIDALRGGLVVSCQAPTGHPLRSAEVIGRLARCAELGGAVGVRVNGAVDIRATRRHTAVPLIGLHKVAHGERQLITPELELAKELVEAGADIIAVGCTTDEPGLPCQCLGEITEELQRPVMADVATFREGLLAWESGAALVGTTLSGYTTQTRHVAGEEPDLRLVEALSNAGVRVVAEGRYSDREQVEHAFEAGAWCVVVGTAITDPVELTRRFAAACP